jgi:leucyl aminopeptidase
VVAHLALTGTPAVELDADALVIGLAQGDDGPEPLPGAEAVAAAFDGGLPAALGALGATGAVGEVTRIATFGKVAAATLVAVGFGKDAAEAGQDVEEETVRRAAGTAIRALAGQETVAFVAGGLDVRALAEGALLGAYDFDRYRTVSADGRKAPVARVLIALPDEAAVEAAEPAAHRAKVSAGAVHLARDLVNAAPNELSPPVLAEQAAELAGDAGLEVEVLDEVALAEGGYGGILGVGSGSDRPPRMVTLTYHGENPVATVALVGKGITFDSGGISIKPPSGMGEMKSDMSGAAAVLSATLALATLKLPLTVRAYLPLAENLLSGSAYRPGDVLVIRGGKTVEVHNTDAEGRLVLADAIVRACEDGADYLIEVSTLTGGQVVALGQRVSGLMGSDALCDLVSAAADKAGEPAWRMPLPPDIRKLLDSAVADLCNVPANLDRAGHMLQGGAFLAEFVDEGVEWAHLDIAGPSFSSEAHGYTPKGGTGLPARTLLEVLEDLARG